MPYITKEARKKFDNVLEQLPCPANAGELNYVITRLCIKYFRIKPDGGNYQSINDICGVLYCAAAEFYRRVAACYEHKKIVENGDVYPE